MTVKAGLNQCCGDALKAINYWDNVKSYYMYQDKDRSEMGSQPERM